MKYHIEVSDDYLQEFEAENFETAYEFAEKIAKNHSRFCKVVLFPGKIRSDIKPIATISGTGKRLDNPEEKNVPAPKTARKRNTPRSSANQARSGR